MNTHEATNSTQVPEDNHDMPILENYSAGTPENNPVDSLGAPPTIAGFILGARALMVVPPVILKDPQENLNPHKKFIMVETSVPAVMCPAGLHYIPAEATPTRNAGSGHPSKKSTKNNHACALCAAQEILDSRSEEVSGKIPSEIASEIASESASARGRLEIITRACLSISGQVAIRCVCPECVRGEILIGKAPVALAHTPTIFLMPLQRLITLPDYPIPSCASMHWHYQGRPGAQAQALRILMTLLNRSLRGTYQAKQILMLDASNPINYSPEISYRAYIPATFTSPLELPNSLSNRLIGYEHNIMNPKTGRRGLIVMFLREDPKKAKKDRCPWAFPANTTTILVDPAKYMNASGAYTTNEYVWHILENFGRLFGIPAEGMKIMTTHTRNGMANNRASGDTWGLNKYSRFLRG